MGRAWSSGRSGLRPEGDGREPRPVGGPDGRAFLGGGAIQEPDVLGMSVYAVPPDQLAEQYRRLVNHAIAGDIRLYVEQVQFDFVADAWRRQGEGTGAKLVVIP